MTLEGAAAGERLQYLGAGRAEDLRGRLERTDGIDALVASGQLEIRALDDIYGAGHCVDPAATVAAYAVVGSTGETPRAR